MEDKGNRKMLEDIDLFGFTMSNNILEEVVLGCDYSVVFNVVY